MDDNEFDRSKPNDELLIELGAAIQDEESKWAKLGIHTDGLAPDLFFLSCKIDAISQALIESELITRDEMNVQLKLIALDTMRGIRIATIRDRITNGNSLNGEAN